MRLLAAFLLAAAPLWADLSEAEYQARLKAAGREIHAQAAQLGTLDPVLLKALKKKVDVQAEAADFLDRARVNKSFTPALGSLVSDGENSLDSALSDFREEILEAKPGQALPAYDAYKKLALTRAQKHWENIGQRYEIRYGGGEALNWLEIAIDNQFYRLQGGQEPPAWEPILRFSPINYHWNRQAVFSMFQAGLNYYFFSGTMKKLNPVGLAIGAGNLNASTPILNMLDAPGFRAGAILHVKKFEIGYFHDPGRGHIVTSSFNFQVVSGWF